MKGYRRTAALIGLVLAAGCGSWRPLGGAPGGSSAAHSASCLDGERDALEREVQMLHVRVAELQAQLDAETQRSQALAGQIEQLQAIERILEHREKPAREASP